MYTHVCTGYVRIWSVQPAACHPNPRAVHLHSPRSPSPLVFVSRNGLVPGDRFDTGQLWAPSATVENVPICQESQPRSVKSRPPSISPEGGPVATAKKTGNFPRYPPWRTQSFSSMPLAPEPMLWRLGGGDEMSCHCNASFLHDAYLLRTYLPRNTVLCAARSTPRAAEPSDPPYLARDRESISPTCTVRSRLC